MRKYIAIIILFVFPTLLFPTPFAFPHSQIEFHLPSSYDDILTLLDDLESGKLETECSDAQLDQINEYLAYLATEGILPGEDHFAMLSDVTELLSPNTSFEVIFYKNVFGKAWEKTKKFVKKHKKEIIIGAAIVVAGTIIAVAIASTTAAAATGAAATTAVKATSNPPPKIEKEIAKVKEAVIQEETLYEQTEIQVEENLRRIGSLIACESVKIAPASLKSVDHNFSTNYAQYFTPSNPEADLQILNHQIRGEQALVSGYNKQAISDFDVAIDLAPERALPYLERGIAHLNLGQYEQSLGDYQTYSEKAHAFPDMAFTKAFAKSLPKGMYESGSSLVSFIGDIVTEPIHTATQMYNGISCLVGLALDKEWNTLAESLVPEVRELIANWDTLSSEQRGELAGYALGKHGGDFFLPRFAAKRGKQLAALSKTLKNVEKVQLLEATSQTASAAKATQMLKNAKLVEDIGLSTKEIKQLSQLGKLEETLNSTYKAIVENPSLQQSVNMFKKAREFLQQHKGYMPEGRARELIHKTGIRTYPRPKGIPQNYRVKLSNDGGGIKYVHPHNEQTYVRVMPGKPYSPLHHQRKPYVVHMRDGKTLDNFGRTVSKKDPSAHIPLEKFHLKER